jgi:hypothetical protein
MTKLKKDGKPKKSGCAKGENRGQGRKPIPKEDKAVPMSISIKGNEEKKLFEEFKLKLKR